MNLFYPNPWPTLSLSKSQCVRNCFMDSNCSHDMTIRFRTTWVVSQIQSCSWERTLIEQTYLRQSRAQKKGALLTYTISILSLSHSQEKWPAWGKLKMMTSNFMDIKVGCRSMSHTSTSCTTKHPLLSKSSKCGSQVQWIVLKVSERFKLKLMY